MSDQLAKTPETSREAAAEIIRWMNATSSSDVPVYSYLVKFLDAYAAKIALEARVDEHRNFCTDCHYTGKCVRLKLLEHEQRRNR